MEEVIPPRAQGICEYLVCRFKNSNKPTKSQSAFYYHPAPAILNNSNSCLLGLTAPTYETISLWSTLLLSIILNALQRDSFNSHFNGKTEAQTKLNGSIRIYPGQPDFQVCIFNLQATPTQGK